MRTETRNPAEGAVVEEGDAEHEGEQIEEAGVATERVAAMGETGAKVAQTAAKQGEMVALVTATGGDTFSDAPPDWCSVPAHRRISRRRCCKSAIT